MEPPARVSLGPWETESGEMTPRGPQTYGASHAV
jgi:hypothetical protein